ncbi:hypothetical protein P3X46_015025 [Hevea brasiliensis]|uniref:Transmembrane protein n=1 Tax=Hevea brasiliensis TaxID=3981 RepID=A0ABQ9LUW3_HEVBR|nr:uncharacterized protein LOC110645706 isoform X2 [Hevea brasiliensis]XP_021654628.2 uncharacterized protein LOC110645706 isoform X2 [Hevea brasiliensis]KAJ9171701.1 hypothetical protein P3X46_015025 [Hevea brasiliensis]
MGRELCYRDLPGMMDRFVSGERELEVDLESGGTTSEEDGINELVSANKQNKKLLNSVCCGPSSFDRLGNSSKFGEDADESVEFLLDKNSEGEQGRQQFPFMNEKIVEGKQKKKNSRKAPKPPKPPKGPSLDAADQKLVQEITEIAMRKRARIERIRVLKKKRATKSSSWNSSLYAMAFTVLFCLILIFQGICSRNSGIMHLQGSPEPAVAASEDLISVQFYKNSAYEGDGRGSSSPSLVEGQVSGSELSKKK